MSWQPPRNAKDKTVLTTTMGIPEHTHEWMEAAGTDNIYEKRNFLYVKKDLRLSRMDNGRDSDCEKSRNWLHFSPHGHGRRLIASAHIPRMETEPRMVGPLIGINIGQPLETSLPQRRCTQPAAPSVYPRYPPRLFSRSSRPLG